MTVNSYGVDVAYFKKELTRLIESLPDRPREELARYLRKLADICDEDENKIIHSYVYMCGDECEKPEETTVGMWAGPYNDIEQMLLYQGNSNRSVLLRGTTEPTVRTTLMYRWNSEESKWVPDIKPHPTKCPKCGNREELTYERHSNVQGCRHGEYVCHNCGWAQDAQTGDEISDGI